MKEIDGLTDEQFEQRANALREDVETKADFVCNILTDTNLFDFIQYEIYGGDSDKMYEALADYFNDDYAKYCEDIISTWFKDK